MTNSERLSNNIYLVFVFLEPFVKSARALHKILTPEAYDELNDNIEYLKARRDDPDTPQNVKGYYQNQISSIFSEAKQLEMILTIKSGLLDLMTELSRHDLDQLLKERGEEYKVKSFYKENFKKPTINKYSKN